jgi:two-component system sensor histidine kinase MprB
VEPNGSPPSTPQGQILLPTQGAEAVASGTAKAFMSDVTVDGARLRMYTFEVRFSPPYEGLTSVAVQLARPLAAADNVLSTLRWVLALVFLAVVAMAAGMARIATRRVLTPLATVSATAQLIGETDDLSQRINVHSEDEVGQLADNFNSMLERLESSRAELDASVKSQRQLVADASHELRTPVTSLRTNIEVLLSGAELEDEDRTRLLTDVVEQSEELSSLVADLIEVARGDSPPERLEDVRLDRLVEDALDRARRNAPDVQFKEHVEPVCVRGSAERLLRAVNNLLDNAALHGGRRGPVEVVVDPSGVTVRDHGEGIAESDLPHIFDRFYRGASSRSRQGSGLGLAIVRQAAEQHGGSVVAANAADGGALFKLTLPTMPHASESDEHVATEPIAEELLRS